MYTDEEFVSASPKGQALIAAIRAAEGRLKALASHGEDGVEPGAIEKARGVLQAAQDRWDRYRENARIVH